MIYNYFFSLTDDQFDPAHNVLKWNDMGNLEYKNTPSVWLRTNFCLVDPKQFNHKRIDKLMSFLHSLSFDFVITITHELDPSWSFEEAIAISDGSYTSNGVTPGDFWDNDKFMNLWKEIN